MGASRRAAKRLQLSPSAMSRTLARLRETTGEGLLPHLRARVGLLHHRAEHGDGVAGLLLAAWAQTGCAPHRPLDHALALSVALVAPWAGRLANQISGAWLCVLGASLLAIGLSLAALWPLHGQPWALLPMAALCGAGVGLFQVANNRNLLLSAPPGRSGAASGMQGTARLTGQTIDGLLMTFLFAATPSALAPRIGLAGAAGATLLAALVSRRRAAR